ncbi:MAG TPA: hypothetical protein VF669_19125 [Tepidisphaeraceae bacterium]|jgi:hypothetical protein
MRAAAIAMLVLLVSGCANSSSRTRTSSEAVMFAPMSMRVHPIFTGVKDWTGDNKPDGIEALVEFTDQFNDPTKAAGTVIFELYRYRPYRADPRGDRLQNPWIGSLNTLEDQQARWNRTSRTYTFQLEYPQIRADNSYVLTATFDTGKTRFFDQIILEPQAKEPEVVAPATVNPNTPAAPPATAPAVRP